MHFSFDDGYSALVAWLKTLLPIAALGLLSTIFLFSGKVDVTQSLPYAEHNVAEIIREQRITQPYFTHIAINAYPSSLWRDQPSDGVKTGGFPRAIWPQKRHNFAPVQMHTHIANDQPLAVALPQ
jgi:hypothetical protein